MSVERLEREKEEIEQRFAELCSQFHRLGSDRLDGGLDSDLDSEADKKFTEIAACQRRLYYIERNLDRAKLDLMPDRSLTGIDRSRISSATPPPQIQWTHRLKARFCQALLDAYRKPQKLRMFLADAIDESLDRLSSEGDLEDRCFEAIEALEARGEKLDDLYFAFREENPAKPFVIPRSQMPDIGIEKEPERDRLALRQPPLSDVPRDRHPAHLIFYVTTSQTDPKNSVLVRAELHFFDVQTRRIQPEPIDLLPEDSPVASEGSERAYKIANLASQLDRACHEAAMRLRVLRREKRFQGKLKPIVELFLPLHLLDNSLATWCSDCSRLPANYPIVVRSSERIQDESSDAITAYDNLWEAWETWFPKEREQFPEVGVSRGLHELTWLESAENRRPNFKKCAGVKCFGHWLTPGSARWGELIEAGTPFAFWLCDCDILPAERHAIFDRLTEGDRFQLLSAICDERHCSESPNVPPGGHHLGVFYEDINYLPTVSPFYEDLASYPRRCEP